MLNANSNFQNIEEKIEIFLNFLFSYSNQPQEAGIPEEEVMLSSTENAGIAGVLGVVSGQWWKNPEHPSVCALAVFL